MTTVQSSTLPIGKTIAALRMCRGLSQRAAAKELGISHVFLSNMENNKNSPTVRTLDLFWKVWGVDVYLMAAVSVGRKASQ